MALEALMQTARHLNEEQLTMLINFAKFLEEQNKPKPIGYYEDGTPYYRRAGAFKGKGWMADDFDEPLDDFKENTE